jgi:hypothetical protein
MEDDETGHVACMGGMKNVYEILVALTSQNIVRVIESRRMRWIGHVARMVETRSSSEILVGLTSQNIIRVIKSKMMISIGHVARMVGMRNAWFTCRLAS